MTSSPMPAFTLQAVRERVRELRDIVGGALQRFADDIERDRQTLERHLDVPRWLWVPHESGTELAPLVPHGKRWAADVARRCRFGLARVPTPYLLTPERVTAITWDVALAMIEDLPEPDYVVTDKRGYALLTTSEWRLALSALDLEEAATLTEAASGSVLLRKPPGAAA